jgi:transposase
MNYDDQVAQLAQNNQALSAEVALLNARCEQYAQAYDYLKEQMLEMQRRIFGKKSERYVDPENKQLSLLDDVSAVFDNADAVGEQLLESTTQVAAHTRNKKSAIEKELPRRIEIVHLSDEDKMCTCGLCKTIIRYETKDLLHYQPPVIEIVEQRREVAACANCCDNSVVVAPAPLQILPKTKATEEFLSFLAVSKLDDRQPFYHLERQLKERHGIDCSRQTMARWMIELMEPLMPIHNLLKDSIIEYNVASCDATTLQVLKETGRAAETKSYAYCFRGGPPDKSVILYGYNASEHKQFVFDWFTDFNGYLHVDGDSFFNLIGDNNASLVNCNAHARRKFEPIAKANKGRGVAKEAMRYFKELYKVEREAKNNNLSPEQRHQLRQEKSKPLMDEFNTWLDDIYPSTLPQSALGKAVNYCILRRKGLMRYLDDGRLEIDNNLTEQEIKPLVITRKSFLFCDTVDGAHALCLHFGLIRTAKLHGLDPYHYYVMLLKSIPHCKSAEDYEKLLPWNIGLDYKPKAN